MGQIVIRNQVPVYCNLAAIQSGGTKANQVLANGEIWLVDTTNANKTNGTGVYDAYIKGNGSSAAKNLTVQYLTAQVDLSAYSTTSEVNTAIQNAVSGKQNTISDLDTIRSGATLGSTALQEGETFGTGDDTTASFNSYSDTVWNKQQTLSQSQQEQVRNNIGAAAQSTTYTKNEITSMFEALNGNDVVITEDHTSVSSPAANTIYREQGTDSYTDWMYDGAWKEIATYSFPGVDNVPADESNKLVKSGGVYGTLVNGLTISKFAYSTFTAQQPNITLSTPITLSNVGDYIELDVNPNGTNPIIRRVTSYNYPIIKYSTANTFAVRLTINDAVESYNFLNENDTNRQVIKLVLDSTDGTNNTFKCFIDGTLVTTHSIVATRTVSFEQIGYNSTMTLYSLKYKSGGIEGNYTKFADIEGAIGITDTYVNTPCYGLETINEKISELEAKAITPSDMYYSFTKVSSTSNAESHFCVYQRLHDNVYIRSLIVLYNNSTLIWGYWRLERTSIGTLSNGAFTITADRVLTPGENEFVLQWTAGSEYNYSSGYSGGFHFGEKIGDTGTFANFIADGNIVDTSADIPLTPCSEFYYKELSAIYQKVAGTIACYHYKETHFEYCGYKVLNKIRLVQSLDFFAYFGIVCVGRNISEYAMPENVSTLNDMGTGTTAKFQFVSNNNRIHYEGGGYCVDVESHINTGDDDSLNELSVYNSTEYNKYYRKTQTIEGSILNCVVGETSVKIYPIQ